MGRTRSGLNYGGVPTDESEVIIRLDKRDRMAYVNSTWPEWSRKFERLHGSPKRTVEQHGKTVSAFWVLPLEAVSIRRGKRQARKPAAPSLRLPQKSSPEAIQGQSGDKIPEAA